MLHVDTKEAAKYHAKKASNEIKPWVKIFARIGFMTKGIIFILVGILSLLAAFGVGNKAKGTSGAFASVASKPFGEILLWLIGSGLIGYILWQFIQIFKGKPFYKPQSKGIMSKLGAVLSCIVYIGLASNAFSLAMHAGKSGNAKQTWTARLLATDFGPWVAGLTGIGIIFYGLYQMYSGWNEKFLKQFKLEEMSDKELEAVKKSGKIGLIARGTVFCFLGFFIIQMALTANPNHPKGLDGTLEKILQQPYGPWILGFISIGLALYGLFQILKGKNKHITL